MHIAVAHHPPLITLHSIQDGREERKLHIQHYASRKHAELASIWWYKEHRKDEKPGIPDIFKRQNIIVSSLDVLECSNMTNLQTGSAHSILKTQPLLDALPDDSDRLSYVAFSMLMLSLTLSQLSRPLCILSQPHGCLKVRPSPSMDVLLADPSARPATRVNPTQTNRVKEHQAPRRRARRGQRQQRQERPLHVHSRHRQRARGRSPRKLRWQCRCWGIPRSHVDSTQF